MFFLGLTNLYIFMLVLLNWPVRVRMIKLSGDNEVIEVAQARNKKGPGEFSAMKVAGSESERDKLENQIPR